MLLLYIATQTEIYKEKYVTFNNDASHNYFHQNHIKILRKQGSRQNGKPLPPRFPFFQGRLRIDSHYPS